MTTFEVYRYQILPIDRYFQGDFGHGIPDVETLIARKNDIFADGLRRVSSFKIGRSQTADKLIYTDGEFFLYRLAANRSLYRETKEFTQETLDTWPSVLVAVWNAPNQQFIAIQRRTTAFRESAIVVKSILSAVEPFLEGHQLTVLHKPLFESRSFWSMIYEYQGSVESIEFEFITPNLANISGRLNDALKNLANETNSVNNKLHIEADAQSSLHISEQSEAVGGLVEYCSEGGGNISVKVSGIRKLLKTQQTTKEVHVEDLELEGDAERVVNVLKEILS